MSQFDFITLNKIKFFKAKDLEKLILLLNDKTIDINIKSTDLNIQKHQYPYLTFINFSEIHSLTTPILRSFHSGNEEIQI